MAATTEPSCDGRLCMASSCSHIRQTDTQSEIVVCVECSAPHKALTDHAQSTRILINGRQQSMDLSLGHHKVGMNTEIEL